MAPDPCLEQFAGFQALAEFGCGKDEDAVFGAAALTFKADDHALRDPGVVLSQCAREQALQIIMINEVPNRKVSRESAVSSPTNSFHTSPL